MSDATRTFELWASLSAEVEKVKRTLSASDQQVSSRERELRGGNGFAETLIHVKFEELNMDLFRKAIKPAE